MEQIYNCYQVNNERTEIEFKEIFGDNTSTLEKKKSTNPFLPLDPLHDS